MQVSETTKIIHQCWSIAGPQIIKGAFKAPIKPEDIPGILESRDDLKEVIPANQELKRIVHSGVWEILKQLKNTESEVNIPTSISIKIPLANLLSIRSQLKIIIPLAEAYYKGDFQKFKELFAQNHGLKSEDFNIPHETFFQDCLNIIGKSISDDLRDQWLRIINTLLDDKVILSLEHLKQYKKEVAYILFASASELISTDINIALQKKVEEEILQSNSDPEFVKLIEPFKKDFRTLIEVVMYDSALKARNGDLNKFISGVLNVVEEKTSLEKNIIHRSEIQATKETINNTLEKELNKLANENSYNQGEVYSMIDDRKSEFDSLNYDRIPAFALKLFSEKVTWTLQSIVALVKAHDFSKAKKNLRLSTELLTKHFKLSKEQAEQLENIYFKFFINTCMITEKPES